ncbi:MAG: sulfatase-like hydrolase/transferase, partial [Planctomycetota bacterium]
MAEKSDSTETRPNVVWMFSDQHRGQAMSCAGDVNVQTPNMDRLAAEGVWFRQARSGFPLCCPARGSILTGRYPHRCVPGHEMRLPGDATTIADVFNEAGYDTAYFGKWHLDGASGHPHDVAAHLVPRDRRGGFKTWLGYENINAQFDCHVHGHRGDDEVPRYRLPAFETDALTDLLVKHLEQNKTAAQPFFAALSVQPPHDPYTAPAEWMARHHPARLQLRDNVPPIAAVREQARRDRQPLNDGTPLGEAPHQHHTKHHQHHELGRG